MVKGETQFIAKRTEARAMAQDGKKTSPGEFINQVKSETSKVVWPTREETIRTAIFVFIMMLILSLFFLGVDSLFSAAVRWLLSLA
jgi:preprotein translocase subunit SecE